MVKRYENQVLGGNTFEVDNAWGTYDGTYGAKGAWQLSTNWLEDYPAIMRILATGRWHGTMHVTAQTWAGYCNTYFATISPYDPNYHVASRNRRGMTFQSFVNSDIVAAVISCYPDRGNEPIEFVIPVDGYDEDITGPRSQWRHPQFVKTHVYDGYHVGEPSWDENAAVCRFGVAVRNINRPVSVFFDSQNIKGWYMVPPGWYIPEFTSIMYAPSKIYPPGSTLFMEAVDHEWAWLLANGAWGDQRSVGVQVNPDGTNSWNFSERDLHRFWFNANTEISRVPLLERR